MFKLYEVDPDADTLLIVPASSAPFAEWHDSSPLPGKALTNGALPNGHHGHHTQQQQHLNGGSYGGALNGVNGFNGANGSAHGLNGSVVGLANGLAKVNLNGTTPASTPASTPELRIKVSSKHLSLASRHFGNKFRWKSSDPAAVQPDGRVHVTLDAGIDPAAATVVMNIVHGRGHKVPRHVDLDTLAKIAVFVDRYRCYDAVEAYADRWIGQLVREGHGVPDQYGRELVLWIFVAYVFHQAELFKRATAVAVSQSTGPIPDLGLTIREKIIRSIDSQRQELVVQAVTIIHAALNTGANPCTLGTDSFLLSALVQSLSRHGVGTWPHLARPLHGVGFAAVASATREVEALHDRWHSNAGPAVGFAYGSKVRKRKTPNSLPTPPLSPEPTFEEKPFVVSCTERLRLTPLLRSIEAEIGGLDLESSLGYYLY